MLKVILVDDEFLVRLAFANTINWEEHGFLLVGAASNGLEAWEMIQKEKPDVVITDLTMPKMGGLELIEKVKNTGITCEFVVLSCHNEFEYVKEALKLGVFDYILKLSMDMQELMDIMVRLKEKIENQRKEEKQKEGQKVKVLQMQELADECFQVVVVDGEGGAEGQEEKNRDQILGLLRQMTAELSNKETFLSHEMPTLLLWETPQDLYSLLSEIQEEGIKYLGLHLNMGVGTRVQGSTGIRQSFEEAMIALGHSFYQGEGTLMFYDRLNYQASEYLNFKMVFPTVPELLEQGNVKELRDEVARQMEWLRQEATIEPRQMRMYLHELLTRIKLKVEERAVEHELEDLYAEVYQRINRLEYMEDIQQDVIYFIDTLLEQMHLAEEHEIIWQVKRYVQTHLSENLQLCEVSRQLGLSSDYMSHLFSTETGMRYTDYVNRVRVEQVCKRLMTTNEKIYEVGEACGFETTNYLTRVFRRYMGMSPLEWKKSEREKR